MLAFLSMHPKCCRWWKDWKDWLAFQTFFTCTSVTVVARVVSAHALRSNYGLAVLWTSSRCLWILFFIISICLSKNMTQRWTSTSVWHQRNPAGRVLTSQSQASAVSEDIFHLLRQSWFQSIHTQTSTRVRARAPAPSPAHTQTRTRVSAVPQQLGSRSHRNMAECHRGS